ncbi:Stk1 family PASTA domain-containing Ser/Thr kinase [Clostridium sp. BJN0001]|uniref:Stk1 family PASTA domain-containing Ser/Thr kinase n=1 Tax=Clostridium sp. BJN0001 TaxID=2930219 RepID=UPI001FD1E5EF|nr:Stk1 family PASTA domain-containing Ser/Thr kinase [Clostridium sp. BJN0001]
MEGIILGDRYELVEKIGEGGMSVVYKAKCHKLNRFDAVKILKKEFADNKEIVEKFKGEATAIAALSDNNIVNILDVGTQDGLNYIVMEYVKGSTLKEVIKKLGKMNYEEAVTVSIQIAKALDCAHRNNIIHRDVKPQNILVSEDGTIKVTDFGIAKSATASTITNTTKIIGSAHYLSPEQARGSFIDCRTDLYSLGVVLYEMVTGVLPFEADTAVTIALKHLQEEPVPPKDINSKIPESLNQLILKAMQKEPSKRYQTAKEMIADLERIKNNPDAIIDEPLDSDSEHTIIMPAVNSSDKDNKLYGNNNENKSDENDYEDDYDDDEDDDDYDDKKSLKKKKLVKIFIGAGIFIALILIGILAFNIFSKPSEEVTVPDNLVGMSFDDAKAELDKIGLVAVQVDSDDSDEEKGTVIQTNPTGGTKVKKNSQVRIVVSSGKTIKMIDLTGQTVKAANTLLEKDNLKISTETEEYSNSVAAGKIISQDPEAGTDITSDTEITVIVSKGPEVKVTRVPDVKGKDQESAENELKNIGLKPSVTTENVEDESKNGIVLKQSATNIEVREGTSINIVVGKYVAPKEEPKETSSDNQDKEDTTKKEDSDKEDTSKTTAKGVDKPKASDSSTNSNIKNN